MTDDIIKIEQFQGNEVRVIVRNGVAAIPLVDIAKALSYDRSALSHTIRRNAELFEGLTSRPHISDPSGKRQETLCLTRDGVIGLLMRMQPTHSKTEEGKSKILAFQRWAIDTLSKIISGEMIPVPARLLSDDVREALKVARIIHEETGVSLPIAQSFALEKVGAADWQKLLPAATMPSGYLTPTDIGNRIGKTARQVNLWLYNNKLQQQDASLSGEWRLTEAGKMHAEEFPFTRNNHSGYQIKWRDSVLQLMNVRPLVDPQAALTSG